VNKTAASVTQLEVHFASRLFT